MLLLNFVVYFKFLKTHFVFASQVEICREASSPASMSLILSPPPAIVALLENEDPGALGKREFVGLLGLVVVLDDGGADSLRRLGSSACPARRLRGPTTTTTAAAPDGRAIGR